MKVIMLDTVEDANQWPGSAAMSREELPDYVMSYTEIRGPEVDEDGKRTGKIVVTAVHRIDKLFKGRTYDLDDRQAKMLIGMKYAVQMVEVTPLDAEDPEFLRGSSE